MTYQEFFKKIAEPKIKNFYRAYRDYYKANAIDYEDLSQEIYIMVWQMVENIKDKSEKELGKYLNRAVRNKLIAIKRDSKKYLPNMNIDTIFEQGHDFTVYNKPRILLNTLKSFCSKIEYQILYKRFVENKTFKEIGQETGFTKMRINQIYHNLLKRLKMRIKK